MYISIRFTKLRSYESFAPAVLVLFFLVCRVCVFTCVGNVLRQKELQQLMCDTGVWVVMIVCGEVGY
jgi:hypothetical protein